MIQKSTYSTFVKSFAVALLLGSYLSAFVINELHHVFAHDHQHTHESCSEEAEKDPCHRFVFHNDVKVDCGHDGHFHETAHECDLCDVLMPQLEVPKIKLFKISTSKIAHALCFFEEKIIIQFSDPSIQLRGPPVSFS